MTTVFSALVTGTALKVGSGLIMYSNIIVLMVTFFLTQWDVYFNGILDLWYINVTEAQFFGMMVQLIPAIMGPNFWVRRLTIGPLTLAYGEWILIPSTLTCIMFCISSVINVITYLQKNPGDRTKCVQYASPCLIVAILYSIWCFTSYHLLVDHVQLFCICVGFLYCNLVGRLVTARVCKLPYDTFYYILVLVPLAIINSLFKGAFINEVYFLYIYCAYSVLAYLHFGLSLIQEMTTYLNIKCLTIPYPPVEPKKDKDARGG